ncbi:S8 family peptidase [Glycomyces xiaoerkulensis]|uniref:S8 family peptidase n=1 Tax=Glycomyces xiaoerkulensis TaxID=2038139 RepID=UPI000C26868B|nr:S8 family peptidase [Glycomyces xiaoerkulensis]
MGSSSPRTFRRAKTRVRAGTRVTLAAATVPIVVAGLATAAGPAAADPPSLPEVSPEYVKQAPAQDVDYTDGYYIVQLDSEPIATYDGDQAGIMSTSPDEGETIDFDSPEVEEYREFLADEREEVIEEFDVEPAAEYDTVLSGFATELTADEAQRLAASDKVASVMPDKLYQLQTATTPEFLGLEGRRGAWNRQFGDPEKAGEGVIVGVLDTGIWPENPSFAPLPEPRPDQDVIDEKWNGECEEGQDDDPEANITCNNKLIGARWFDIRGAAADQYASPRDGNGHGTHTASTAAGNYRSEVVMDGEEFGTVSGMAPASRVAAYKVCWAGCAGGDLVAGIEAAVNDGVDVINFSIGSLGTAEFVDSISIAFFNAASAGVFVAASAGNDGPGSTVDHQEPWVTTVGASTHDMTYRSDLTFGGTTVQVAAINGAMDFPIRTGAEAAFDDADPEAAAGCDPGTLDPAKTEGFGILCERGNLFTDMANQIAAAGGEALVVRDVEDLGPASVVTSQAVPTVHMSYGDGLDLADWIESTEDAAVSVTTSERVGQNAPEMAAFSSAGPALAAGQNMLKPDLTAPGVEVVAGLTPEHNRGNDYGASQGTSMASPHVAGLGALLLSDNPGWSPMAVKSAMMTTAYQTDDHWNPIQRGGEDATVFDYGAGHVDGAAMFDPGLVYESGAVDWIQYICGTPEAYKIQSTCDSFGSMEPSQLNYPSITVAELTGNYSVTRTLTNVSDRGGFYKAKIKSPEGTKVKVDQKFVYVEPGESFSYTLDIERKDAAFDEWAFGEITWKELGWGWHKNRVRSPITVKPTRLGVEDEVVYEGTEGTSALEGAAGFDGTLSAGVSGLVGSEVRTETLTDPDSSSFPADDPQENSHVASWEFETPADAAMVRFATFDADHPDGTDLDVFVYEKADDGSLTLVDYSATGTSNESVTLPGGHTFVVFVDLWGGPQSVDTSLHGWVVPSADEGNLSVDPAEQSVSLGGAFEVELAWSGLEPGARYLGTVDFGSDGAHIDSTIVNVTT